MRSIYDSALDLAAVNDGRWVTVHGHRFRVRSVRSEPFRERLEELREPVAKLIAAAPGTAEAKKAATDTFVRAVAEEIVTDWDLVERDGTPIPFSKAKSLEILSNPSFVHILEGITSGYAADDQYLVACQIDAGNSESGSGGS